MPLPNLKNVLWKYLGGDSEQKTIIEEFLYVCVA